MNNYAHAKVWADVTERLKESAEEAKNIGAVKAELMTLQLALFASHIAAAYRESDKAA